MAKMRWRYSSDVYWRGALVTSVRGTLMSDSLLVLL